MKSTFAVLSALFLVALSAGTAAAASPADASPTAAASIAAAPWSVSYETASASGSAEWTPSGLLGGQLALEGELTNNGTDCYFVMLILRNGQESVPASLPSAAQCGPGSQPVEFVVYTHLYAWSASVEVCRGEPGSGWSPWDPPAFDCGTSQRVP